MVPGTRTKKLKILQNRCRTGNQEPNQEVQALTSWVDQEVIGLTGMLLAFYKKLLFFYQDNRLNKLSWECHTRGYKFKVELD